MRKAIKIFAMVLLLVCSVINPAYAKATNEKVIFIVGGLAGSGKTTHIQPLMQKLSQESGKAIAYLDKDVIGATMPAGTTSPQIYAEMVVRAEDAIKTNDVIIMEGNTIGNLSCFTDFVREQHKKGVNVVALYFQCKDPQEQFNRLKERAKHDASAAKRDEKKLQSFEYYRDTDRPGEIKRHDDQLTKNKELIDQGVLKVLVLETGSATIEPKVSSKSIVKNVDLILDLMNKDKSVS